MKSPKLESVDNDCFSGLGKPSDSLRSLCFFLVFLFMYLNKNKKGKGKKRTNTLLKLIMFSFAVCLTQQVVGLCRM